MNNTAYPGAKTVQLDGFLTLHYRLCDDTGNEIELEEDSPVEFSSLDGSARIAGFCAS